MSALVVSNVVLWALTVVLAFVTLALVRQLGVLHERITPVGALMLASDLKVGEGAPLFAGGDLAGRRVSIGAARADGRSTLIMFVSPTCPVCKALIPVLRSSKSQEESWLEILLASDGEMAAQQEFVRANDLGSFSFIVSTTLGMTYRVSRLPFAVLIDARGVLRARGIINSREHLESLFEAKRLGVGSIQEFLEARAEGRMSAFN